MSYIDIDDEIYKEKYEEVAGELDIAFEMIEQYAERELELKKIIIELKVEINLLKKSESES